MRIYLVGFAHKGEEFLKIGIAKDIKKRLMLLDSPLLPFPLRLLAEYDAGSSARLVEKNLHRVFKGKHMRGEWFLNVTSMEFLEYCRLLHKNLLSVWVPTPRKDPKLVWVEEQAFGDRMLGFINKMQRRANAA